MTAHTPNPSRPRRCAAAFTLIELALSVFVMGVAILGIFGLSRLGIAAAAEAEDEARAAMFADDVFTTMRLYADAVRGTNSEDWIDFWENIDTNEFVVAGADFWQDADGYVPTIIPDGEIHTNVFYSVDVRDEGATFAPIPEYALHYRISIDEDPYSISAAMYSSDGGYGYAEVSPENTYRATLHVWNGGARRRPEAYSFYTHFFEGGELK